MAKGPGGFVSGGFDPLNAPDAPIIDSVSAGILSADVTVSAPTDAGEGTITSYVVSAKQSDGTSVSNTASAAGTVSLTLTAGGTTTFAAQAISEFGPGAFSGYGNSTSVYSGQALYAFGRNTAGQLGQGDLIDRSSPVQVGSLTHWAELSSGNHSLAVTTAGELYVWGFNGTGQLGNNSIASVSSPVQLGSLTNWSKVSVGRESNSYAIKTDGTLWAWGRNIYGQLGQNNTTDRSSPVQVGALSNWSKIASGGLGWWIAIKTDGTLWGCGINANRGELGTNNFINRSSPVQIGSDTDWEEVSGGYSTGYARKTNGELYAWGENYAGQQGVGDTIVRSSPVQIGSLTNWSKLDGHNGNTCHVIKTDGTLWGWGLNSFGMLGDSTSTARSSPVQIGADTNWLQSEGAYFHSAAVKTNGTLWTWGFNQQGQLGLGDVTSRNSPVQVGAETNWIGVTSGGRTTIALEGVTS